MGPEHRRRAEPGAEQGPPTRLWLSVPLGSLPRYLLRVLEPACGRHPEGKAPS